jgi:hypothetical protein
LAGFAATGVGVIGAGVAAGGALAGVGVASRNTDVWHPTSSRHSIASSD